MIDWKPGCPLPDNVFCVWDVSESEEGPYMLTRNERHGLHLFDATTGVLEIHRVPDTVRVAVTGSPRERQRASAFAYADKFVQYVRAAHAESFRLWDPKRVPIAPAFWKPGDTAGAHVAVVTPTKEITGRVIGPVRASKPGRVDPEFVGLPYVPVALEPCSPGDPPDVWKLFPVARLHIRPDFRYGASAKEHERSSPLGKTDPELLTMLSGVAGAGFTQLGWDALADWIYDRDGFGEWLPRFHLSADRNDRRKIHPYGEGSPQYVPFGLEDYAAAIRAIAAHVGGTGPVTCPRDIDRANHMDEERAAGPDDATQYSHP